MISESSTITGSNRGISLPLVTGLVTLLMVASVAANELIIRTIRSVRGVESSNRAYFAAEAGIEDGLYELSPHLAGYQTPTIDGTDYNRILNKDNLAVRHDELDTTGRWNNRWSVESRSGNKSWNGKMSKDQKLIISLFTDNNESSSVGTNAISVAVDETKIRNVTPKPLDFSIKFSVPIITGLNMLNLIIDNDQDGPANEDIPRHPPTLLCQDGSKNPNPEDDDCDGKVDEDSDMDPVILWKLSDRNGRSLIPLAGCLGDPDAKTYTPAANPPVIPKSVLCEGDFKNNFIDPFFSLTLDSDAYGLNESGVPQTIRDFIDKSDDSVPMQFEFLIVAPMEYMDDQNQKVPIPFIRYEVNSSNGQIPYPYFTLKSDGYYGIYKQSLTTTVTPKTTVPLFDFTIIQQK